MIAVLSVCAILIVLRGASTIWLAEEAWRWWTHRLHSQVVTRPVATAYIPPTPPPSYEAAEWITPDDYPPSAIRAGEQGAVRIRWTVNAKGRAIRCDIVSTSGHRSLDNAACHAILRSARYKPAKELAGRVFERRVVWRLPDS